MSERVTMPALGESVTEGTVTRWLKNVGDTVEVDEPLLEVSTDKVDTEIPSPVSGTLLEILVQEDETVEVGAELAVIGEASESGGGGSGQDDSGAEQEQTSGGEDVGQTDESPQEAQEPADQGGEADEPAADEGGQEQGGQEQGGQEQEQAPQAGTEGSGDGEGETVTMPALGESVTEGTVTRWLKSEGDTVEVDEPLLEVSTDKVDTEIPSPVAGVLTKILAGEDETVEVGAPLAVIGGSGGGGGAAAPAQEAPQQEEPEQEAQPEQEQAEPEPAAEDTTEAAEAKQDEAAADAGSELAEEAQVQQEGAEESAQRSEEQTTTPEPQQAQPAQGVGTEAAAEQQAGGGDVSAYVTPLVRKLAAQHGVDLSTLKGTGVGGRIRKQDVLDAARKAQEAKEATKPEAAPAPAAEPARAAAPAARGGEALQAIQAKRGSREKMSRLRQVIAKRMVESLQTSAQLTTVVEVDVTKVARLRNKVKDEFQRREGVKLSFLPFFAMATIEALKQHPNLNASVEGDEIIYHAQENLGIAVDTEKGLIVPVIKDAGDLNIAGLARKIADLAERTRSNKISPDELGGGTFTLTNTGSRGALFDTPIINQPQVGILGTGAVVKRPVVVTDEDGGETIAIRSMVYLALTYDHRIVDGADAARFLTTIKERLEEGSFEV
jgi:2-oxoglutarate dehydrogenase E2 component (dihydrolipoamide succinyltransferase)